jgi:hypothetical protein
MRWNCRIVFLERRRLGFFNRRRRLENVRDMGHFNEINVVRLRGCTSRLRFFNRRMGLENVRDMRHFNVARLRGCTTLHWLELSEVISNNAGESFLFIGPGVDRQFRGPLQIVLMRKRQKER